MKLLLTSNGISNKSIARSLRRLLGKPFSRSKLVFIPTAANGSSRNKKWLIRDMYNCAQLGFEKISILNLEAAPRKKDWQAWTKEADVILIGGGDTFYLMDWLKRSGLAKELPRLLKKKIYVGISAGSIATGPDLSFLSLYYGVNRKEKALGLVDFYFRSHFNSPDFPKARPPFLQKAADKLGRPIYALDDDSAMEVVNGRIRIVTEGKYGIFSK